MNINETIKSVLKKSVKASKSAPKIFFKTGAGEYAEHDRFMGVSVPTLRKIAKDFESISFSEIEKLLKSSFNEERLLALIIYCNRYKKGKPDERESIFRSYLKHIKYVNNWNLVDASAHLILGAHLMKAKKNILTALARSPSMWERRIAIVSTWYFIREKNYQWTTKIAKILLTDQEDLIQKAVGWMLREVGKQDMPTLLKFLDKEINNMPRTMLRYAIEKLQDKQRKYYLLK